MSAPQGIISYPSLTEFILSAQFPLQHGISPSICTFITTPIPGKLIEQGTLDLRYGNVRITFPDCKIDSVRADKNEDGFERWMVTLLDRRWKWRFAGWVSGHWNQRRGEILVGQNLATPTVRSAKRLAEICLDAMGETRYDTRDFPKDVFPEVEWDFTNAAEALASLCDKFGFRIVLTINNTVRLCKVGKGKPLPKTGDEIQLSRTLDPPERPDEIIFAGAPNRHQFDLPLECVLRDFDGQFRNLDDLTYAPKDASGKAAWGAPGENQFTADQITANPKLALWNTYISENIYRTWRIKEPIKVDVYIKGAVKALDLYRTNIVPLEPTLIDTETNEKDVAEGGSIVRRSFVEECKPLIFGLFNAGGSTLESNYHETGFADGAGLENPPGGDVRVLKDPLDPLTLATGKYAKALYVQPFDIDFENGYVQFADGAVRYKPSTIGEEGRYLVKTEDIEYINDDPLDAHIYHATTDAELPADATVLSRSSLSSFRTMPALLWLRVAFPVRYNQQEGSPLLYAPISRKMPGQPLKSGVEYIRAHDIRYWIGRVKDGPLRGNKEEYLKAAKQYLDAKQAEYDFDDSDSNSYCGFKDIDPDGAIQQVTFEVVSTGYASTRASRNKEEVYTGISYTERRIAEKTKALFDAEEKRKAGG